jgi:Cd2+/Zn2+-exporting ATPase
VSSAEVTFETGKLTVSFSDEVISPTDIINAVGAGGYTAELEGVRKISEPKRSFWLTDKRAITVLMAAIPLALGALLQLFTGLFGISIVLLVAATAIAGYKPAHSAVSSLRSFVFDMNVLMTVAVIGAFFLGQWLEAATVMFLYAVGTMLEAFTMDKTRHAIHRLLEIAPSEATVKVGDATRVVPTDMVQVGDIVVVKPGERIPIDGTVMLGRSSVNQSTVTGESLPVVKDVGDPVFAGTLNNEGYLEIASTRRSSDSTLSHIIRLIEDAQTKKAPAQQFINRFSIYYTPVVIGIAIAVAVIPPLFGQPFSTWFYRSLVLLVISCPCALVISTPVSIASAIGAASRNGVLIKGGAYLETAATVSAIVFDKTGTLTSGHLSVTDVVSLNSYSEDELIAVIAAIEARSGHPLADAVVEYARDRDITYTEPQSFESMPGRGLKAQLDSTSYYIGNPRLFSELSITDPAATPLVSAMQHEGKTVFMLGTEDCLLGIMAVADKLRHDARLAVHKLHDAGVKHIVMLTGDNTETAKEIAAQAGISEFRAELLPEDKVNALETISKQYGRVVMVGDGVNDAPAISRADVGIAMGAIGSDVALETADIALMGDELINIPYVIRLSRRALRIIKQNVFASVAVKLAFIVLAVAGMATLWMAVFADTGISILVILNGMRLFSRKI